MVLVSEPVRGRSRATELVCLKINYNLTNFRSPFSQNLPDGIFSILAYSFLRMVFKDQRGVYTEITKYLFGGLNFSHLTPC